MTTVFYKPRSFASCDSKWSINGHEINDIKQDKFILHASPSTGEMLVTLMAGSFVAIVLHQAHLSQIITGKQFYSLFNRYDQFFDLEYDSITFVLSDGTLKSKSHGCYPRDSKSNGIFSFGSGGIYAGSFFYHAKSFVRKKRKKVPPRSFSHPCSIICAMNYAYSQDKCSGGKVHKLEWVKHSAVHGTMLPTNENYFEDLNVTLVETMREIEDMYIDKAANPKAPNQGVASLTEKKRSAQEKRSLGQVIAKTQESNNATKMTVSTVVDHLKWFESL